MKFYKNGNLKIILEWIIDVLFLRWKIKYSMKSIRNNLQEQSVTSRASGSFRNRIEYLPRILLEIHSNFILFSFMSPDPMIQMKSIIEESHTETLK